MPTAQELLSSIAGPEEHIVIGADRNITVPKPLQRIAVQFDHDVETVTFDCPRYWDDIDMSTMTVYINYKLPNGDLDAYPAKNITVEGDIMHFDWTISNKVTQYKGKLTFLVCIKKTGTDGAEVNHWNSELCTDMYISEGMECEEQAQMEYSDLITQLLERMTVVEQINVNADEMREMHEEVLNETTGIRQTSANAIKGYASGEVIQIDDISPVEHNVKGKVNTGKNLFDGKWESGAINTSTGEKQSNSSSIRTVNYIPVQPNATYYFSVDADCSYFPYSYDKNKNFVAYKGMKKGSFSLTMDENECYIILVQYGNVEQPINTQIELGDTATEYEPYIDPTTVTVTGCGKNLFDYDSVDFTGVPSITKSESKYVIDNSSRGVNYFNASNIQALHLKPNTEYVCKATITKQVVGAFSNAGSMASCLLIQTTSNWNDDSVNPRIFILQGPQGETSGTFEVETRFTTPSDLTPYISLSGRIDGGTILTISNIQLELGSTATDYEPFKGNTYIPNPDGTCDVKSVSPFMQIFTDTPGVTIDAEYNRDTVKAVFSGEKELYMFSMKDLAHIRTLYPESMPNIKTGPTTLNGKDALFVTYRLYTGFIENGVYHEFFHFPLKVNPNPTSRFGSRIENVPDFRGAFVIIENEVLDLNELAENRVYNNVYHQIKVSRSGINSYQGALIGFAYELVVSFNNYSDREFALSEINQMLSLITHIGWEYTPTKHKIITPKYLGE